jgi:hypothetical protein
MYGTLPQTQQTRVEKINRLHIAANKSASHTESLHIIFFAARKPEAGRAATRFRFHVEVWVEYKQ